MCDEYVLSGYIQDNPSSNVNDLNTEL